MRSSLLAIFLAAILMSFSGCSIISKGVPLEQTSFDEIELPKELKRSVAEYYLLRSEGEFKKLYQMEAPHFRYLNGFDDYLAYQNTYRSVVDRVEVEYVHVAHKNLLSLRVSVYVGESKYSYNDKWIYLEGSYYHILEDLLIFKS